MLPFLSSAVQLILFWIIRKVTTESYNGLGWKTCSVSVQAPCNKQAQLQLDQVAQSPTQPDLDCPQEWGIYHLSGQPVLEFHRPQYKYFLLFLVKLYSLLV